MLVASIVSSIVPLRPLKVPLPEEGTCRTLYNKNLPLRAREPWGGVDEKPPPTSGKYTELPYCIFKKLCFDIFSFVYKKGRALRGRPFVISLYY
jgi:hypothetical protein